MGAIEETRKLIQDFLAPELREIKARLEALEETTKVRFDAIEETTKSRFDAIEETTKSRFDAIEETTKSRFDAQDKVMTSQHLAVMNALNGLTNYAALAERLTRLENERGQQAH